MFKKTVLTVLMLAAACFCFATKVEIGKNKEIILNGKPFIPIMVFLQEEDGNIDKCLSIGANSFMGLWDQKTPKAKEYLDKLAKKNAYAAIMFEPTLIEHPALLFWFMGDEPDMPDKNGKPRTPTSKSIEDYQKVKAGDKTHPTLLNLTRNFDAKIVKNLDTKGDVPNDLTYYKDYKKASDIIGYDVYPVFGNMAVDSLWWVASAAKELRKVTDYEMPLSVIVESNGGSKWVTPSKQRHPYPYEIRCEVWMALVNGATIIAYFPHTWVAMENIGNPDCKIKRGESKYYSQFGIPEDNMKEMKKINAQITKLTNVLCSANVNGKVKKEELGGGDVEIMVKEDSSAAYIFAVNNKRKAEKVKFSVEGLKKGAKIEVDEENRSIDAEDGTFTDDFSEHAVHIYKIKKN